MEGILEDGTKAGTLLAYIDNPDTAALFRQGRVQYVDFAFEEQS